jgi:hypothetical protein
MSNQSSSHPICSGCCRLSHHSVTEHRDLPQRPDSNGLRPLAKACTDRLALLQSVGALSDSARRVVTAIRIAGLLPQSEPPRHQLRFRRWRGLSWTISPRSAAAHLHGELHRLRHLCGDAAPLRRDRPLETPPHESRGGGVFILPRNVRATARVGFAARLNIGVRRRGATEPRLVSLKPSGGVSV